MQAIVLRRYRKSFGSLFVVTTISLLALGLFLVMAALTAMAIAKTYNRLVAMKNQTENGFNQINIQLQRRHDLIPNLVTCVGQYMSHEKEALEAVIAARNQASGQLKGAAAGPGNAAAMSSIAGAESALTGALGRLSFVMEAYPELKADATVASLTEELTSTENRISFARQAYNDWATAFNSTRQSFPTITFADKIGFADDFSLLEFDEEAINNVPQVSFSRQEEVAV